jgi:flagellar export protein FliJ
MKWQALRNYREQIAEGLRAEVAALQRALADAQDAHRRAQARSEDAYQRYVDRARAGATPAEMMAEHDAVMAAGQDVRLARAVVDTAAARRDAKMAELLEAMRGHKQIVLLEERALRRRRAEQEQALARAIDEVAGRRHGRAIARERA